MVRVSIAYFVVVVLVLSVWVSDPVAGVAEAADAAVYRRLPLN